MSDTLRGSGRGGKSGAWRARREACPAQGGLAPGEPAVDVTAIFRQHYAELVRVAVMLVGDRSAAEDVVKDVFARLHARRDRPSPLPTPGLTLNFGEAW